MFDWYLVKKIVLLCCLISFVASNEDNEITVRLKNTLIVGRTETTVENTQYHVFKGVPYAEPPVGPLKFRRPEPLRQWPDRVDATDWPKPCIQYLGRSIMPLKNRNFSEDCLLLNIWTPAGSLATDELKPVLFYIHGGALLWGAASNDAEILATRGDIVVVDIQYRLSTFGFLYTGTDDAPGNVGLWDQAMALEWVNDHIRYFGGDPNQITIMGMSAGSWSVSTHILSPVSRNLFRYAIMQSAAMTDHIMYPEPEGQKKNWLKGAKLIGCNDNNEDQFTEEMVECLRNADPVELAQIPELPEVMPITFMPMVITDGQFLPATASQMLKSGNFKQDLKLLISTAADEASMFLKMQIDQHKYDRENPKNFTLSEAMAELKDIAERSSRKVAINGEDVAKLYFNGMSDNSDFDSLRRTIGIAFGDLIIGCPVRLFGKEIFRRSQFKADVYQYYFNAKSRSPASSSVFAKWWGPSHAEDLAASFGWPIALKDVFLEKDREIAERLVAIIANFVRTGSPGQIDGTEWPKFFAIDDNIIAPYYEFTNDPKPVTNFGVGLKLDECEHLWQKYIWYD